MHIDLSCSFPRFWFVSSPGISPHPAGSPAMLYVLSPPACFTGFHSFSCSIGISCDGQCFINFIFLSALVWVISIGCCLSSVLDLLINSSLQNFFVAFPALEQVSVTGATVDCPLEFFTCTQGAVTYSQQVSEVLSADPSAGFTCICYNFVVH